MARNTFISLHPNRIRDFDSLKNHYFLTDGIVASDVASFMSAHSSSTYARPQVASSLEYLLKNEVIKESPSFSYNDLESLSCQSDSFMTMLNDVNRVLLARDKMLQKARKKSDYADDYANLNIEFEKLKEKLYAEYLTFSTGNVHSPMENNYYNTGVLNQHDVVEFVINKFPVIDVNEDWQKIIELKQDESTNLKHLRFREFTKKLVRENLSPLEIQEEIEYLIEEYKNHMASAKIKYNYGTRKSIFMTSLKVVENLVTLNISGAVESLYTFSENKLELLEAKDSAPGKEIALLIRE